MRFLGSLATFGIEVTAATYASFASSNYTHLLAWASSLRIPPRIVRIETASDDSAFCRQVSKCRNFVSDVHVKYKFFKYLQMVS